MLPEVDERRNRIREDLAPLIRGEIRCDPLTVSLYSTDGSLYQVPPLGVVTPRDAADVSAVVRFAAAENIPLFPRGAGTGLAGESLGPGLVIDFSRHMRRIEQISATTVRVQPGVVCSQLNRHLRPHGRYFPPDPSGANVTTIGSMLALDAAGSHSIRIGSTRDHVESLDVVLAGGRQVTLRRERRASRAEPFALRSPGAEADSAFADTTQMVTTLLGNLADLLERNRELIDRRQPPLVRNRCGYFLRGVLEGNSLDMPRLLVGSEGTLALFTAATLHTMPLPKHRGVVLLVFPQVEMAVKVVQELIAHDPAACDLFDRRVLSLACEGDSRFRELVPVNAEAALLVEHSAGSQEEVQRRLKLVVTAVRELVGHDAVAHTAETEAEVDFLWSLPETVVPLLARLQGEVRPLPFVEDVAVPPEALHEFLVQAQGVFRKHRVIASLYAHAAAGQVHLRPFLPSPTPESAQQLDEIARDLYEKVFLVGGTISGEHGTGFSRSAYVREQYGELYDVFREIKQLFDPQGLFNPGKVLNDDPLLVTKNLRSTQTVPNTTVELQLNWKPDQVLQAASRCNGCGQCRTREPDLRMCPLFRVGPQEETSPRAKANLMRQWLGGELPADSVKSDAFKHLADLCFNCKQCQSECPSNVDIPHLMIEAKAGYVVEEGLSRAEWVLSRAHLLGAVGSAASVPFNWALENPAMRWLIEKATGISRLRKLPPFARRSFLGLARRELLTRPGMRSAPRPIVYFVDHYANNHDPELGRAFVAILRHHRIPVYVPAHQKASGMALISAGDLEAARELALENLRELADFAREGCQIVCTEPSAALCLTQEYPLLVDHPDVGVVAEQTIEAGNFLAQLRTAGKLRTDFRPLDLVLGYHTPCHLKALARGTPLADILRLIPRLQLQEIDHGCSGMAGAWGLTQANFAQSIRIGWGLISRMRQGDLVAGVTECSSCKMQMEQGTTIPTLHPLKILALAYGLMPEIQNRLRPSRKKLLVT